MAVENTSTRPLRPISRYASKPETPDQWLDDPEEVQVEETDLRSLLGAVEALQVDPPRDPGGAAAG
jgi:hypothetical protein